MPILYVLGWLVVQPLRLFWVNINSENLSLLGTVITFCFFLLSLPGWTRHRWGVVKPWVAIGLSEPFKLRTIIAFVKGFCLAFLLITVVLFSLWSGSWLKSFSVINLDQLINAIFLGIGVGIAEELIFRGWLLGEMIRLLGSRVGVFTQAVLFSLSHIRFQLPLSELIVLLFGLFLLGLVLGIRRSLDKGSLWGAIALHGGLVGGWFLINSGLILIDLNAPSWLVGPGGVNPNPIGGVGAIISLSLILFYERKALIGVGRSLDITVRASSKGQSP